MADRETVITHLQIIHTWAKFARERDLQFFTAKHLEDIAKWTDDAIELMNEQNDKGMISDAIHETAKQFRRTIVRCKDCRHATMTSDGKMCKYCAMDTDDFGDQRTVYHDADWFCADEERRDDDA